MSVGFSGRVLLKEGLFRAIGGSGDEVITGPVDWSTATITETKLTASDMSGDDNFGFSVSISSDGNTAIVGAYGDNSKRGSAYIWIRNPDNSWIQQSKLTASDGIADDYFGYSVTISSDGNTAIVGAQQDDDRGNSSGSAYIFTRSGSDWTQQGKITAPDGVTSDNFGFSVSISSDGNTAIVGSPMDDDKGNASGSTYIFTHNPDNNSWPQQRKIVPSDGATFDFFGHSVSISSDGNTAIIGAYGDDDTFIDSGSAYIWIRSGTTWTQQAKLLTSDRSVSDYFGYSVSISSDGNTAIIGAYGDDDRGSDSGSAYIFTRSGITWSEQSKLTASDGSAGDSFGRSVSISSDGNTAIIGAYGDNSSSGSAYIFYYDGSTWSQRTKLVSSDGLANDWFGQSVAISSDGNTVVVGAYGNDDAGSNSGSAYIFTAS